MNLFLISQFGQLIHHQALIRRDNLTNNKLVILYTSANLDVPNKIRNEANTAIFDEIILHELPLSPLNYDFDNITIMTEGFRKLLTDVEDLYMSSFEYHYSVLHQIAKRKEIKTHLVEEGLATYKYAVYQRCQRTPKFKRSVITATQRSGLFNNKFYPLLRTIYVWGRDLVSLPRQIVNTITYSKKSEYNSYKKLLKTSDERSAFLKLANEFDSINVAFPELLKSCFYSNKNTELNTYQIDNFSYRGLGCLGEIDMNDSDILYLSQMYNIPSEHYASSILSIIEEYLLEEDGARCFIKFHPRDKVEFISEIKKQVDERKLNNRILIIENADFPVETIIMKCKPKKILGISTTTLVYANQLSNKSECISITKGLLNYLGSHCTKKTRNVIMEHTEMLNIFDHIHKR